MPTIDPSQQTITRALNLRFAQPDPDSGATTVREYMRALLATLWSDGEYFNSKRPFGRGTRGWQTDVYREFVRAGLVAGTIDSAGCLAALDVAAAHKLVQAVIVALCAIPEE